MSEREPNIDQQLDETFRIADDHDHLAIIQINRINYVHGLHWTPAALAPDERPERLSGPRLRDLKEEGRSQAEAHGFDLYLLYKGQYGFAKADSNIKVGCPSLATAIASAGPPNMLVVLPVEQGAETLFYILAVFSGKISPDSDRLFHYDEAMDYVNSLLSEESMHGRIANLSMFVGGYNDWASNFRHELGSYFEEQTLYGLVEAGSKDEVNLSDVTQKTTYKYIFYFITFVALVALAFLGWEKYQAYEAKQNELLQAKLAQDQQEQQIQLALIKELHKAYPYGGKVKGVYALSLCQNAMARTPIVIPGWIFESMSCFPLTQQVYVNFRRDETEHSFLSDVVPSIRINHPNMEPKPKILVYKNSVKVIYDYGPSFKVLSEGFYKKNDEYGNLEDQATYLQSIFDRVGFLKSLHLNPVKEPISARLKEISLIKDVEEAAEQLGEGFDFSKSSKKVQIDPIVFRELEFSVVGILPPENFLKLLAPLKAFDVHEISVLADGIAVKKAGLDKDSLGSVDGSQLIWSIKASLFEGEKQSVANKRAKE